MTRNYEHHLPSIERLKTEHKFRIIFSERSECFVQWVQHGETKALRAASEELAVSVFLDSVCAVHRALYSTGESICDQLRRLDLELEHNHCLSPHDREKVKRIRAALLAVEEDICGINFARGRGRHLQDRPDTNPLRN